MISVAISEDCIVVFSAGNVFVQGVTFQKRGYVSHVLGACNLNLRLRNWDRI